MTDYNMIHAHKVRNIGNEFFHVSTGTPNETDMEIHHLLPNRFA